MIQVPANRLPGHYDPKGRFSLHDRNAALITKYGGGLLRYRQLPEPAQLALAQYMSIDGEAWQVPAALGKALKRPRETPGSKECLEGQAAAMRVLRESLDFYRKKYGKEEFGYVPAIPTVALIESVMKDADMQSDWAATTGWEGYHKWFMEQGRLKHDAPDEHPWPVILSGIAFETLEDGWNRFHLYCERKLPTVPAVFFPRPKRTAPRLQTSA